MRDTVCVEEAQHASVGQWKWIVLSGLAAWAVALIPWLIYDSFYYYDDVRHQYAAPIYEIGQRLVNGEFPWITIRSWFGGNLVGEGQYALFNPVSLAVYALLSQVDDIKAAFLIHAGIYIFLSSIACHLLARQIRLSNASAFAFAVAYATSSFQIYWYASSWLPGLVAGTWFIFACAAWLKVFTDHRGFLPAIVCTWLTFTSGWPHATVALGLVVFVLFAAHARKKDLQFNVLVVAAGIAAVGMALPSLLPTIELVKVSSRLSAIKSGPSFTGALDYIIGASWPTFVPQHFKFGTPNGATAPFFYLAWFAVPALLVGLRRWVKEGLPASVKVLLILAAIFCVLTLGPQQSGSLRYPLRFLPFAHLFLLLVAVKIVASPVRLARVDVKLIAAYVLLGLYVSVVSSVMEFKTHITATLVTVAGLVLAFRPGFSEARRQTIVAVVSIVLFFQVHYGWWSNDNLFEWSAPETLRDRDQFQIGNSAPTLLNTKLVLLGTRHILTNDQGSGNTGLWEPGRMINGYTPVGMREYSTKLGLNLWSWSRADKLAAYFAEDPRSGLRLYELLRLDEIRVARILKSRFEKVYDAGNWLEEDRDSALGTTTFRYLGKYPYPGTVSWISDKLQIVSHNATRQNEEILTLRNDAGASQTIIFARAWYPGYRATLGSTELPVKPHQGLLVSVEIPAQTEGELRLFFEPPWIRLSAPLAAICLLAAMAIAWYERRLPARTSA